MLRGFRPLQSPEFRTDHKIVEWNIKRRVERWLNRSDQIILVVGNMPDAQPEYLKHKGDPDAADLIVRKRYVDDEESWQKQQKAIDGKMREWIGDRKDGEVTVALCSGSRGVDLESYNTILHLRQERPGLQINVVSILPLDVESFRQESVTGSLREDYWNGLFNQLLSDPHAQVHEPHFRPITFSEYAGAGKKNKVTLEGAVQRSIFLNGNQNEFRVFSDTQQELMRLTEKAYRANPQVQKTLRMLLVTDGGKANGDGGTNELVARFYKIFGEDIEKRRSLRQMNLRLGLEDEAKLYETICIIQDGMILEKGRTLESPLEEEALGQNGEYVATVAEAYADKFTREGHDSFWDRKRTMSLRRQQRSFAASN